MSNERSNKLLISLRGLMSATVRISEAEFNAIADAAASSNRTVSEQTEHWIKLGRRVEGLASFRAEEQRPQSH